MTQSGQPDAPTPPPSSPPPEWQSQPKPADWQSAPQPPSMPSAPQAPGQGMPAWTANLTSTAPVAGPAGYFYADVPNRAIAYIIDGIIVGIAGFILAIISRSILGVNVQGFGSFDTNTSLLVAVVLSAAVSAAYFIYMWANMRATMGMRLLGMQIGHESDGRTITYQQAALRFAVMWGPYYLAGLLAAFAPGLAALTYLVAIAWGIVLIVTTAQSPTKQGLHDKYAQTMVVKAARAAG